MDTFLFLLLTPAITILWHEFAHALFALALSRHEVRLVVGFGPSVGLRLGRLQLRFGPLLFGGYCAYAGGDRRGDRALIAAAGPVSSVFLAALAWNVQQPLAAAGHHSIARFCGQLAIVSALGAVLTALPVRYPPGNESDGLAVVRALFPATRLAIPTPSVERRPARPLRGPFAIVLALVVPLAFLANVWTGIFTLGLFAFAYAGERG
jgi:membrane-associated protease RseP (regulator of RpoE activity)